MFVWLYGFALSLTVYFLAEEQPLVVQLIPLSVISIVSFLLSLRVLKEKKNASLHLASLSTNVLLLILLWTQPDDIYFIFTSVFAVICILYVVANANIFFLTPPRWLAVANFLSLTMSTIVFILLYASIKNETSDHMIYIPLSVLALLEVSTLIRLQKMEGLTEEKIKELQRERITYALSVFVVLGSSIAYTAEAVSLSVNSLICTILYAVGFAVTVYSRFVEAWCRSGKYRGFNELGDQSDDV